MKWEKLGVIFAPQAEYPWMQSHASTPFVDRLSENIYRVYFTCRDSAQRSHIAWADVDIEKLKVVALADKPILTPGQLGTFDDSGAALGWVSKIGNEKFFYYLGWNLCVTVPWRNSIGLAKLNQRTGLLERNSQAPLLDRNHIDPFSISYPCVLQVNGSYKMWYGSNLSWGKNQEDMKHVIKYATSSDGLNWNREGQIAIPLEGDQYAISKPCVLFDSNKYKMWYSYRGTSYRIGYAESIDGINWNRMDQDCGIDVSSQGWDSEMICYPYVFEHRGELLMIYNGNGYGRTGFGLAQLI